VPRRASAFDLFRGEKHAVDIQTIQKVNLLHCSCGGRRDCTVEPVVKKSEDFRSFVCRLCGMTERFVINAKGARLVGRKPNSKRPR